MADFNVVLPGDEVGGAGSHNSPLAVEVEGHTPLVAALGGGDPISCSLCLPYSPGPR